MQKIEFWHRSHKNFIRSLFFIRLNEMRGKKKVETKTIEEYARIQELRSLE
jgi:hypothetical protein